jgi:hypothetical protein
MISENAIRYGSLDEVPETATRWMDLQDAAEAYIEIEIIEPVWGEDEELVEQWFKQGEAFEDGTIDWINWVDLYKEGVDRSDLFVHWLRCLFEPQLPRPPALMTG